MSRSLLEQLRNFLTANGTDSIVDLIDEMVGDVGTIDADTGSILGKINTIDSDTGTIKSKISTIDGDTGAMRSNAASISIDTDALEDDMSRGVTNIGGKVKAVAATTSSGALTINIGATNNARCRMISLSVATPAAGLVYRILFDAATVWEGYFTSGSGRLMLRFGEFWDEFDQIQVLRITGTSEAKISFYWEDLADDSGNYAIG